jgi:hypothetical protein
MIHRYDDGPPSSDRSADARRAAPADHAYTRRIDCAESPRSRERLGGSRGGAVPEPEAYTARSRRPDVH